MYLEFSLHFKLRLSRFVVESFLSFLFLRRSYVEVERGVVKSYKNWRYRKKTKLILLRVTRPTCIPRSRSTRPPSQALQRDCKGLWKIRLVENNGRNGSPCSNPWHLLCKSRSQTELLKSALSKCQWTPMLLENIVLEISFSNTMDTISCCFGSAPTWKCLWNKSRTNK